MRLKAPVTRSSIWRVRSIVANRITAVVTSAYTTPTTTVADRATRIDCRRTAEGPVIATGAYSASSR